ncbi:MAG: hypothetical protein AAFV49_21500, partial [Pseudomonadota bacterium]
MASEPVILTLPPDASEDVIERVKAAFPEATLSTEAAPPPMPPHIELEAALANAAGAAGGFGSLLSDWWAGLPGGALSLFLIAVALLAAYGVERGVRLLAARFLPLGNGILSDENDTSFSARLLRGGRWAVGRILSLVLFAAAARVIGRSILPAEEALRDIGLGILGAVLFGRGLIALVEVLTAPRHPERRLISFSDADAEFVLRIGTIIAMVNIVLNLLHAVILDAAGTADQAQLALILVTLAGGAAGAVFFVAIREPVIRLMVPPGEGSERSGWLTLIARRWHWAFVALIVLDGALKILGILGMLGADARAGAGPVILLVMMSALCVAAIAVFRRQPEIESRGGLWLGGLVLAEGFVIVIASILLLKAWGIDPLAPRNEGGLAALVPGLVEAGMIVAIGTALWRATTTLISRRSGGDGDEPDDG